MDRRVNVCGEINLKEKKEETSENAREAGDMQRASEWRRVSFHAVQRQRGRVTHGRKTLHDPRFQSLSLLITSLCRYFRPSRGIIKTPSARPALSTIYYWIRADLARLCASHSRRCYVLSQVAGLIPITTSVCPPRGDKRCTNRRDIATTS